MLSRDEVERRLVGGLNPLTLRAGRDLFDQPPGDKETLQQIGIGEQQARTSVRRWLNEGFRTPGGWRRLTAKDISTKTTWEELVAIAEGGKP